MAFLNTFNYLRKDLWFLKKRRRRNYMNVIRYIHTTDIQTHIICKLAGCKEYLYFGKNSYRIT